MAPQEAFYFIPWEGDGTILRQTGVGVIPLKIKIQAHFSPPTPSLPLLLSEPCSECKVLTKETSFSLLRKWTLSLSLSLYQFSLSLSLSLSVSLSLCLSVSLSLCLSVSLSLYLSVSLSLCLSVPLSLSLSSLSLSLSLSLSSLPLSLSLPLSPSLLSALSELSLSLSLFLRLYSLRHLSIYVPVYMCIYIYMYIYVYTYIYIYIYVCVWGAVPQVEARGWPYQLQRLEYPATSSHQHGWRNVVSNGLHHDFPVCLHYSDWDQKAVEENMKMKPTWFLKKQLQELEGKELRPSRFRGI